MRQRIIEALLAGTLRYRGSSDREARAFLIGTARKYLLREAELRPPPPAGPLGLEKELAAHDLAPTMLDVADLQVRLTEVVLRATQLSPRTPEHKLWAFVRARAGAGASRAAQGTPPTVDRRRAQNRSASERRRLALLLARAAEEAVAGREPDELDGVVLTLVRGPAAPGTNRHR